MYVSPKVILSQDSSLWKTLGHCRTLGINLSFEVHCNYCSGLTLGTQDALVEEQSTFLTAIKPARIWEPKNQTCPAVDSWEAGRMSWWIMRRISIGNLRDLCQDIIETSMSLRTISVFDMFEFCTFPMQFLDQSVPWLHAFGEAVALRESRKERLFYPLRSAALKYVQMDRWPPEVPSSLNYSVTLCSSIPEGVLGETGTIPYGEEDSYSCKSCVLTLSSALAIHHWALVFYSTRASITISISVWEKSVWMIAPDLPFDLGWITLKRASEVKEHRDSGHMYKSTGLRFSLFTFLCMEWYDSLDHKRDQIALLLIILSLTHSLAH